MKHLHSFAWAAISRMHGSLGNILSCIICECEVQNTGLATVVKIRVSTT